MVGGRCRRSPTRSTSGHPSTASASATTSVNHNAGHNPFNRLYSRSIQHSQFPRFRNSFDFPISTHAVFKFDAAADSVLEVSQDDYNRSSTANPVATYKASDATVPLPRSGPYYFISGTPGSCDKGERLVVVVMSEKHGHRHASAPVPAPASPQAAGHVEVPAPAPAPAPATGAAGRTAGSSSLLLGALLGAVVLGF